MLVVKSPVEQAWIIALEWQDLSDLSQLDHNRLRDYVALFPDAGLSKVIQAFLKSDISPFQQSYTTDTENGEDFIVSEMWDETEILGNFIV
jgi:superkiller protein 3